MKHQDFLGGETMTEKTFSKQYDVVVIGGGMGGFCAAVAAARQGAKTALIQNRPVLGGNTSSEIKVGILGADRHCRKKDARETGIVEEVLLESKKRNPYYSFSMLDIILWEKARFQENLDLYLNTQFMMAHCENDMIKSVEAIQLTTEKHFIFTAKIFIDATGDGMLGKLSGADYLTGWESKETFGEPHAPDEAGHYTAGNSIQFIAVDMGKPVPFEKPFWAYTYTEEDLSGRPHSNENPGKPWFGYWWFELGGDKYNTIDDAEEIRDELLKTMFGIWDHIKNGGDHGAENYALEWVQFLPGKRESRRLVGDYILKEQDLLSNRVFEDAVAYGGWPIDSHTPDSIMKGRNKPPILQYIDFDGLYTIPYRCLYSRNIKNLMMAGRIISTSHLANSSTRVMGTCSVIGQAAGTAAAIAVSKNLLPRDVIKYIDLLQQTLMDNDCYIPGFRNTSSKDLALKSKVSASSCVEGCEAVKVINGYLRNFDNQINCWVSQDMNESGQWIRLDFGRNIRPDEIVIKFDSNLNEEICVTMNPAVIAKQSRGVPPTIVKDYDIDFYKSEMKTGHIEIRGNYLRHRRHKAENIECDHIVVRVLATNGDKAARIFEIRVNKQ